MKISEFVKELNTIMKEHGDVNVNVFNNDSDTLQTVEARIILEDDDAEKVVGVTITDETYVDAFGDDGE